MPSKCNEQILFFFFCQIKTLDLTKVLQLVKRREGTERPLKTILEPMGLTKREIIPARAPSVELCGKYWQQKLLSVYVGHR